MEKDLIYGIRKSQSQIGIYPIGPKVILKAEFEVTISELVTSKSMGNDLLPTNMKVVAFGSDTHTIELNDTVLVNSAMLSPAEFEWNKLSLKEMFSKYIAKKDAHLNNKKVKIIEYSIVNNFIFDIMAIDTNIAKDIKID